MPSKQPSAESLIRISDALLPVIRQAGIAILALYHKPEHAIQIKADASPVTDADLVSHDLLLDALSRITPDWPVISEEDVVHHHCEKLSSDDPQYAVNPSWLLDPLDGTKEFIGRSGEFCISLGLVVNRRAHFGLIYGPVEGVCYRGGGGVAAQKHLPGGQWERIAARTRPADGGVLISSRRSRATPEHEKFARHDHLGSALKFGRLAEGLADYYLRRGPTMEWDTCAGQAILESAGGRVTTFDQEQLRYGKPEFRNPGFIATGIY